MTNMSQMTKQDKAIVLLESVFGFKLSPEQLKIVKYGYKTPLAVNACAGSGKTTLLQFKIILAIVTGEYRPQNILAITFSKKAQLNMKHRYQNIMWRLKRAGYSQASLNNTPTFVTFHALFYRILKHFKEYRYIKVITSYTKISNLLKKVIRKPPKALSISTLLRDIFRVRNGLIDGGFSWDGYNLRDMPNTRANLAQAIQEVSGIQDARFTTNYYQVIRCYCSYKKHYHRIDFNDMKTLLLIKVSTVDGFNKVKDLMAKYMLCFIDEFQDIDRLQWVLMTKILSPRAFGHLVVIGDDDQSIYSFRGSDPSIILNFTKNVKGAKRLNLSTNYRTSGHVLNAVKPLIMSNKYRLPKKLQVSQDHRNKGEIISYSSQVKTKSSGDILLSQLWKLLKNPHVKNRSIAILVRYNVDILLAVDWLANRGFYVKSKDFLQKQTGFNQMNKVYKIFMNLMWSLCCDSFSNMNNWSQAVGFTKYRKHINSILRYSYRRDYNHLATYLRKALIFDKSSGLIIKEVGQRDSDLLKAFRQCYVHNRITGRDRIIKGIIPFKKVKSLTSDYFDYMEKHHYMSGTIVSTTIQYLRNRLVQYDNIMDFFHDELKKRHILTNIMYDPTFRNKINVMTIHRSKGLQFKYVFLFNLTDQDVTPSLIATDKLFTPHISRNDFYEQLLNCSKDQLAHIDGLSNAKALHDKVAISLDTKSLIYYTLRTSIQNYINVIYRSVKHQFRYDKKITKNTIEKVFQNRVQDFKKKLIEGVLNKDQFDQGLQTQFNHLYESTIDSNQALEEERRLIYVGCTRAENSVQLNIDGHSNPLLGELKIPNYNKMILNKKGKIVPLVEDKQRKVKEDKTKLRKIEAKLRKDTKSANDK